MTWTASVPSTPAPDFEAALDAVEVDSAQTPDDAALQEQIDAATAQQVSAAKAAIKAIVDSGAVGAGPNFCASLSGYANPAHESEDDENTLTNDAVLVSVTQVFPPA